MRLYKFGIVCYGQGQNRMLQISKNVEKFLRYFLNFYKQKCRWAAKEGSRYDSLVYISNDYTLAVWRWRTFNFTLTLPLVIPCTTFIWQM